MKTFAAESLASFRHCSNVGENITYLSARGSKSPGCIHHEIRPCALVGVRHLFRENGSEFLLCHTGSLEYTGTLNFERRGNNHYRITTPVTAGFEKIRNIQNGHARALAGGLVEKSLLGAADQRVHDYFEPFERSAVAKHPLGQFVPIDLPGSGSTGKRCLNQWHRRTLVEIVYGRVGVVHRNTFFGKHFRSGGFSHAKRAGEAEDKHRSAVEKFVLPQKAKQGQKRQTENSEVVAFHSLKQVNADAFQLIPADANYYRICSHIEVVIKEAVREIAHREPRSINTTKEHFFIAH